MNVNMYPIGKSSVLYLKLEEVTEPCLQKNVWAFVLICFLKNFKVSYILSEISSWIVSCVEEEKMSADELSIEIRYLR